MLKRHPYIIATAVAALLATVVWLLVPKTYSATTTVSDEYKEMDLAVGLNVINAQVRDITGKPNTGINDMEVYFQILGTEDFARELSHMQVPGKRMTYGEYLGRRDTIKSISDQLEYNYSNRKWTLTISFTDRDPLVASQMLDSVTVLLQKKVTRNRHAVIQNAIAEAESNLKDATQQYKKAEEAYVSFADANIRIKTHQAAQEESRLEKEVKITEKHYLNATSQYVRQLALKQRSYVSFTVVKDNTVPQSDNRNLLLYFGAILAVLLLLTKGYLSYQSQAGKGWQRDWGDFFSPWSLTVFIWAADIVLYFLQGTMYDIGPRFVSCFTVWIVTLIPASLMAYWLTQSSPKPVPADYTKPLSVPTILFNVLCVVSGLLTLVYATRVWSIVSQFDLDNLLYNLRLYIIEDNSVTGLLNHVLY